MKTKVLLLMLAVTLAGCGSNKSPRAAYLDADMTVRVLAQTFGEIVADCNEEPNECPFDAGDWDVIAASFAQVKVALHDWREALIAGESYWSPMSVAANAISGLQTYMAIKGD